jgi:glucose-1-phosphate adenylyltransferase
MTEQVGQWYSGTSNAIYQNVSFVDQYDPEYVLILSGDHIYKMDYSAMLRHHIQKKAAATIAVFRVPIEEASRFGIMNTDERDNITSFEEKPKIPKSNNASMGIYIFNWQTLKSYMLADELDPTSDKDFGKNIIPAMLSHGEKMVAYQFGGYWKDVGTLSSLWEANMDMLGSSPVLNLNGSGWRIYTRNPVKPPHYIGEKAEINDAMIAEGCFVRGRVKHSVLFYGSSVDDGSEVYDSVVFPNAHIGKNCKIHKAIIGENAVILDGCVIGGDPRDGEKIDNSLTGDLVLVGNDVTLCENSFLPRGAVAREEE